MGGTSILRGEGAVWRTVLGVLFIALIGNGFNLLGLDPLYRQIVIGGIILIAVGIDAWTRGSAASDRIGSRRACMFRARGRG